MENSLPTPSRGSSNSAAPSDTGFSPWQRLKTKRISYLTLPLLGMATIWRNGSNLAEVTS